MPALVNAPALLALVREVAPGVTAAHESERRGRPVRPGALFVELLDPAYELVRSRSADRLAPTLRLVERCCANGDHEVDTAACTCFLESLSNRLTRSDPAGASWVRELLGRCSGEFWDRWSTAWPP